MNERVNEGNKYVAPVTQTMDVALYLQHRVLAIVWWGQAGLVTDSDLWIACPTPGAWLDVRPQPSTKQKEVWRVEAGRERSQSPMTRGTINNVVAPGQSRLASLSAALWAAWDAVETRMSSVGVTEGTSGKPVLAR